MAQSLGIQFCSRPQATRSALRRVIVEVLAALFIAFLTVPWQPLTEDQFGPIDFSGIQLFNHAAATGMQFGRQIIMPEGPLAFLGFDVYDPQTYLVLIVARTVFALVAFWSLLELERTFIRTPGAALVWLFAAILLMGASPNCFFPDCVFLLLLNYFLVHRRKLSASTVAMLIVLAAGSLIRANEAIYAAIGVLALTIDRLARRSARFYLPAAIFCAALSACYLSARQSPGSAVHLLWGWRQVIIGHAEAAARSGPVADALAFVAIVALSLIVVGRSEWKARRWAGAAAFLGIAVIMLLLYKHSFGRQDAFHVWIGPTAMLTLLILYLPAMWGPAGRRLRIGMLIALALNAALLWSVLSRYTGTNLLSFTTESLHRFGQNVQAAVDHISDPDRQPREWESARRELRLMEPLPAAAIRGTVDVYPDRQDVVFAYGLAYAPRPVCESYLANTPVLAALNARHLASPGAAETILFDIAPVDGKFPTLLDGASLPELLSRYNLIDDSGAMLILRRAAAPRRYAFQPLGIQSASFDRPIAVPASPGEMVWARIRFKPRPLGGIVAALYKPASIAMDVFTADGSHSHWNILAEMAQQGFLLSPLVDDRSVMAALYRGYPTTVLEGKTVNRITVRISNGWRAAAFDPEFSISFQRLRVVPDEKPIPALDGRKPS